MKLIYKILFVCALICFAFQCEKYDFCATPDCVVSDANVKIKAKLSGNLDSVINLNDTIWLQIKLPDSIAGNFGDAIIKYLWQDSYFIIKSYAGDTLIGWAEDYFQNSFDFTQHSIIPLQENTNICRWELSSKNYLCYFTPNKPGRYLFFLNRGLILFTDENGYHMKINIDIEVDKKARVDQYINWSNNPIAKEKLNQLRNNNNWYCFEVK